MCIKSIKLGPLVYYYNRMIFWDNLVFLLKTEDADEQ